MTGANRPQHGRTLLKAGKFSQTLLATSVALIAAQQATAQSNEPPTDAAALDEVVVTAQRRSELAVNVPISITAIGGDQLGQGDVQQLSDIMKLTPGMRYDNLGANAQPTIRGVGTSVVVAGAGSNVAIYTDGFYSPNPLMADSELLNVTSVQVLKGPQGTLFGRNSTGGAILLTTSEPSSEESADLRFSYGSYNTKRAQIYATGSPQEELTFDVAGLYRKSDGYLDNITTGSEYDGAYENSSTRIGVKWQAADNAYALLRYSHAKTDDPASVAVNSYEQDGQIYSTAATFATANFPGFENTKTTSDPREIASNFAPGFTADSEAFQLTVKVDLDFAAFSSYTQYRNEIGSHSYDFDASSASIYHYTFDTTDDIYTQEFLLSSQGDGRLQWTTGLFYLKDKTAYPNNRASVQGSAFARTGGSGVEANSIAIFGDVTYSLLDDLYLTVGLRYSADEITKAYYIQDGVGKIEIPDLDDDQFTPRVALRYELNEKSNVYFSYAEGFKSSILNVAGETLDGIEVDPEEIKAYEIGYKYASGAVMLDVATFYYDYKNLQVASYARSQSFIKNAADSTVYGVDVQTRYAFTDRLTMNFGASYLQAEYDTFNESQLWDQCLDAVACGQGYGVFVPSYGDAGGNEMARAPEVTGTLGVNYRADVAGGSLDLSGTLYHTSDFYFDSSNLYQQEAYELLSLRAAWTDPSSVYTVAVYGDNLTDEEYRTQVLPQYYGALSTWGTPRTVGVSIELHY